MAMYKLLGTPEGREAQELHTIAAWGAVKEMFSIEAKKGIKSICETQLNAVLSYCVNHNGTKQSANRQYLDYLVEQLHWLERKETAEYLAESYLKLSQKTCECLGAYIDEHGWDALEKLDRTDRQLDRDLRAAVEEVAGRFEKLQLEAQARIDAWKKA